MTITAIKNLDPSVPKSLFTLPLPAPATIAIDPAAPPALRQIACPGDPSLVWIEQDPTENSEYGACTKNGAHIAWLWEPATNVYHALYKDDRIIWL